MSNRLEFITLPNYPLVEPGDNLAEQILSSLAQADVQLQDGDVIALAQKIVSKAEDRYAYLNEVTPSDEAIDIAQQAEKDPRIVQLILNESKEVVRLRKGAIIVEHKLGYVHAHAGIDQSNISCDDDNPRVLLLPVDPDKSAADLQKAIFDKTGADVCIIINDSAGRAWRNGTQGFAIGTAGFDPVVNLIGENDLFDRRMEVTEVAIADELAAGASFLMGQAREAAPVVLIRGANLTRTDADSKSLIRAKENDLFR